MLTAEENANKVWLSLIMYLQYNFYNESPCHRSSYFILAPGWFVLQRPKHYHLKSIDVDPFEIIKFLCKREVLIISPDSIHTYLQQFWEGDILSEQQQFQRVELSLFDLLWWTKQVFNQLCTMVFNFYLPDIWWNFIVNYVLISSRLWRDDFHLK